MNMLNIPKVSVIITTHNRGDILKRAIGSVRAQTYQNVEIIVVDDGSSDSTQEYLESLLQVGGIDRYIRHPEPKGACAARNAGIMGASGDFIAGLDDDDEYTPDRLKSLVDAYDPMYSYICSRNEIVIDGKSSVRWKPRYITTEMMLWSNVSDNQVLAPIENFVKAGLFDESMPSCQDYDMWMRMIVLTGKARCVEKPLQRVYVETARKSITSGERTRRMGTWKFYKKNSKKMVRLQRVVWLCDISRSRGRNSTFKRFIVLYVLGRLSSLLSQLRGI